MAPGAELVRLFGTYAFSDWVADVTLNKGWDNTHTGADVVGVLSGDFGDHYWGQPIEHQVQVAAGIAGAEVLVKPAVRGWLKSSGRLAAGAELTPVSNPWIFMAYNYGFIWLGIEAHVAVDSAFNPAHQGHRGQVFLDETGANTKGTAWGFAEPGVGLLSGAAVLRMAPQGRAVKAAAGAFEYFAAPVFAYTTIKGFGWDDWRWRKGEAAGEGEGAGETGAVTTPDDPIAFDLPPESSEEYNEILASAASSEREVEAEAEQESAGFCEAPLESANSCEPADEGAGIETPYESSLPES